MPQQTLPLETIKTDWIEYNNSYYNNNNNNNNNDYYDDIIIMIIEYIAKSHQ